MKRQPSRAPSPTPTAFSGISTYQNNSYRTSTRDKPSVAVPNIDYRLVSKTHFEELGKYLAAYLARSPPNSRSTARQKLTRLTIQQFHELSTDVYDELIRRKNEKEAVPFLPVREDFHPKRNQARQKLATLPASRFEDLSSDVYFELARRYPEFKEDPTGRTSADRPPDSGYGGSVSSRRPSEDRRRPSDADMPPPPRRSEENYRRPDESPYGQRAPDEGYGRRKPSQDITRRSEDRERGDFTRRPSATASVSNASDSTATMGPPAQSTTAGSGMIIPNKSTIEEEYIEVPYGREQRESGATIDTPGGDMIRDASMGDDSASEYPGMSPRSPPSGLNGLSSRLREIQDDDDIDPSSSGNKSGDDFYDKYGRSSVNSDRSSNQIPGRMASRASVNDEQEKLRRDYEYKIATMQSQITSLQRDLEDSADTANKWKDAEARVQQLESELESVRRRAEEQSTTIVSLQRELDESQEVRRRDKERESRRIQDDEDELQILRDRCEKLESERAMNPGGESDPELVEQLRIDMEGLLLELDNLNRRNDELMTAKDSDLSIIRDLDQQLKDYKRKYEQAKTELRSVKATSQLFLPTPKFEKSDDLLPMSPDGGILDIHITAFLSAIDSLLTAGRSNAPTRVLTPMKTVVNAVTNIVDDVRAFERRPQRDRNDADLDTLRSLRERTEVTLSNLVAATRTHATSNGLSPVSLLDAAASHVSASITEIGKIVCLRKATKIEQEQFPYNVSPPSASSASGYTPSLRSVDEGNSISAHQRRPSQGSTTSSRNRFVDSPSSPPTRNFLEQRRRPPSQNSSSEQTNSPPPLFDRQNTIGGAISDDSAPPESEDAWAELKPYLEAQTESIVYAIQSVLSGVRGPTQPQTLNDNLTQIITIVSSIVAVCNDNLPPASVQQGNEILRELGEHANKLSEVQAMPELTKESKQVMAKSSFAIANAMKGLMKLG
ncbi:hypothetical protein EST38_g4543 [Candolleomyces aberdarensis]|uniref:GIT Spa2 homology (SHD) domain-containing protein n=1 Tax=Candolleomyces aberdarensis TaxID=2316362 RepID=A0A4Q2DMC4_9AGAR|nr:hypothetical protein EST38_g4543 [Candolleomyces aberdarensis]